MKEARKVNEYFDDAVDGAISEILERWAAKKVFASEDYQNYMGNAEKLQDKIKALLDENGHLVDEMAEQLTWALCCYTEPNYLQGFRDCYLFLRRLELL